MRLITPFLEKNAPSELNLGGALIFCSKGATQLRDFYPCLLKLLVPQ